MNEKEQERLSCSKDNHQKIENVELENVIETQSDFASERSLPEDPEPYRSGHRAYDGNAEPRKKAKTYVYSGLDNQVAPVGKKQSRLHHSLRTSDNFEDELLCRNAKFYRNNGKTMELVAQTDKQGNPEIVGNSQNYVLEDFEEELAARLKDSSDSLSLASVGTTYENDDRPLFPAALPGDTEYMQSCALLEQAAFGQPVDLPDVEEEGEGPKAMGQELTPEALEMQSKLEDARKARNGEELSSLAYDAELAGLSE